MKKTLVILLALCMAATSAAHAEIVYFEFSASESTASPAPSATASPTPTPSPSPTPVPTADPVMQLIEDFQIPLAAPEEDDSDTVAEATGSVTTTAGAVPTAAITTQPPQLYPQAVLDALKASGVSAEDVLDLDQWWVTAPDGDLLEVEVGDCVTVNGEFYLVVAECPPFEKSASLTALDLTMLINFMAGMFVRIYP